MIDSTVQISTKRSYRQFLHFITTDSTMLIDVGGETVYLTNELDYDERIEILESELSTLREQMAEMESE